ncbi:39S ribosomal protein L22, mitochondrial [Dimargaris verticillata]|uniref:39S ribosomal protein L22, mitochondrial n=1 Tax=Dimargaris verticillata TaxID=2761393 RepID=A0A9W8EC17_9FUNG|nr:39S ribosomal protein L22, mitochondrial [Dimargaris verticillata]
MPLLLGIRSHALSLGRLVGATARPSLPRFAALFSTSSACAKKVEDVSGNRPDLGASPLFDAAIEDAAESEQTAASSLLPRGAESTVGLREYQYSTANYKTSYRKLRFLAQQISGKPIQEAINQMEFSPKRWAKPLMHNLAMARTNAYLQKGLDKSRLYVGKGFYKKSLDMKGRGRYGIKHHYSAHIKYILKEAEPDTAPEDRGRRRDIKRFNVKRRVWQPLREEKPIYSPSRYYNW